MPAVSTATIEPVSAPTEEVRRLIGELDDFLNADSPPENRHGYSIEKIFQPNIRFFVARLDGQAVGCGGVQLMGESGEVKRMYVRPAARGKQVAQSILSRLEQEAREAGAKRLVLETGDNRDAAIALYGRCGFSRCGAFPPYSEMPAIAIAHSVFMEKPLGG